MSETFDCHACGSPVLTGLVIRQVPSRILGEDEQSETTYRKPTLRSNHAKCQHCGAIHHVHKNSAGQIAVVLLQRGSV